jgi:hypothetical protein
VVQASSLRGHEVSAVNIAQTAINNQLRKILPEFAIQRGCTGQKAG